MKADNLLNNISDIYFNYKAIINNLKSIGNQFESDLAKLQKKYGKGIDFFDTIKSVVSSKKLRPEDELNDDKVEEINNEITSQLIEKEYLIENDGKVSLGNIDLEELDLKRTYDLIRKTEQNKKYLFNNSVINSITSYEICIGSIFRMYFEEYPDLLNDKSLNYKDLKDFNDFEEAKEFLINDAIKEKMYLSCEGWHVYLKEKLKISIDFFKEYCDFFTELFERRNLIVHNNAIINAFYLKAINNKEMKRGTELVTSFDYVEKMQYILMSDAFLLFIQILNKFQICDEEKRKVSRLIGNIAFEMMKDKKWIFAKKIYFNLSKVKYIDLQTKEMYKLNYWLCCDMTNDVDVINDFLKCDYSDKTAFLKFGFYSLTNNKDELYNLIKSSTIDGISSEWILEWPICAKIREDHKYKEKIIDLIEKNNIRNKGEWHGKN